MSMQPLQGVQAPLTQVLPIGQLEHCAPPAPQRAGVVLVMQTPAVVQQPEGQVAGEHDDEPPPPPVPFTHAPLLQTWLPKHCWQTLPALPHAVVLVPPLHTLLLAQ